MSTLQWVRVRLLCDRSEFSQDDGDQGSDPECESAWSQSHLNAQWKHPVWLNREDGETSSLQSVYVCVRWFNSKVGLTRFYYSGQVIYKSNQNLYLSLLRSFCCTCRSEAGLFVITCYMQETTWVKKWGPTELLDPLHGETMQGETYGNNSAMVSCVSNPYWYWIAWFPQHSW